MRTLLLAIALTSSTFSSFASDSERISQLANEVNELRARVKQLENLQSIANNQQKQIVANGGMTSLATWRKLIRGMSYSDVRGILGEPLRIEGGGVSYWYYANQGRVIFVRDKLSSWDEPQ